jgi:predicted dehydrogenase
MRFLVVGCGSIGKRHIKNLVSLNAGEILAFDTRADRRHEVRSQLGVATMDEPEELWEYNPDVAIIATPTSTHVQFALQAAEHQCHFFVEKPLSDRLEGTRQLLDIAKKNNLVTLVGCNMRFHPGLKRVKRLLEEGAVGRVVAARAEVGQYLPDWHPWEDYRDSYSARRDLGGGIILDATHEIDYLRWMLGEAEAVSCFAGRLSCLEIDTEDTAAIIIRFVSGAIGEIHMDYVQRLYTRSCQIIGDEGTIHWDYTTGEVRWYCAATKKWHGFPDARDWEPNKMYVDEMKHFLKCLAGEEKPALDVFEAIRVLEIALLAKTSSETRQVLTPAR